MKTMGLGAATLLALPVIAALLACGDGGANDHQQAPGDRPGGVRVGLGDIAVAPGGDYVLFRRDETLAAGFIETGRVEPLPVHTPSRLAFSKQRDVVYVGDASAQEIVAVDVRSRAVLWQSAVADTTTRGLRLESTPDDRFVLAANAFEVTIIDALTGRALGRHLLERGLVDLEILPDSRRALVVENHEFDGATPRARVTILDLEVGTSSGFWIPNCADDVVVSFDGRRAFLAPTTCQRDPVSVIDLTPAHERFELNLPGFGPVARAPGGTTLVAFYDRTAADAALFADPARMPGPSSDRYHLMLIDSGTLAYDFAEVGGDLPRYAVTPDGNVLLVDSSWFLKDPLRLFDVATRRFRSLSGPAVTLDQFVLSSDSLHAYALKLDVFDIDIRAGRVARVNPGFTPKRLNISADDRFLFLRKDDSEVCIFELASRTCKNRFAGAIAEAPAAASPAQ
ncbi:MAG TPA: hypothetical protein VI072_27205 [Polyangiaceae bacterium]